MSMTSGSARDHLGAVLQRWSGRPTLVALTVINVITGLGVGATIAAANFGLDAGTFRRCAELLADGGGFCGSPYPPLTGLAFWPLTWVSPTGAALFMMAIGIAVLFAGVMLETRGQATVDRLLVGIAVFTWPPVIYGLLLGQTTLLIAAALYPVARRPDAVRNGMPFGVALALAPKPMLAPILVWMLVWRRHALAAVLLVALALTGFGIAVLGPDQYRQWIPAVTGSGSTSLVGTLSARDMGNLSLWPLDPATAALACAVAAAAFWAILRDDARGFVAALLAGILLAPYSLLYAFSTLLLAVKPALTFAPRATRALALTANLARVAPLAIAWCVAGVLACLIPSRAGARWPSLTAKWGWRGRTEP